MSDISHEEPVTSRDVATEELEIPPTQRILLLDNLFSSWEKPGRRNIRIDELAVLRGHTQHISKVEAYPDGIILTAAADRTLRIWTPKDNATYESMEVKFKSAIADFKRLPSGHIFTLEKGGEVSFIVPGPSGDLTKMCVGNAGRNEGTLDITSSGAIIVDFHRAIQSTDFRPKINYILECEPESLRWKEWKNQSSPILTELGETLSLSIAGDKFRALDIHSSSNRTTKISRDVIIENSWGKRAVWNRFKGEWFNLDVLLDAYRDRAQIVFPNLAYSKVIIDRIVGVTFDGRVILQNEHDVSVHSLYFMNYGVAGK